MKKEIFATKEELINARKEIYGNQAMSDPFVEIKESVCSKNIPPTNKELKAALSFARKNKKLEEDFKKIKKKYEEFTQKCNHKVCVDVPGFPYDIRKCFACGEFLGSV